MTPPCGCHIKTFPEPTECDKCHQLRPVDFYQIVWCPLHAHAKAMREVLVTAVKWHNQGIGGIVGPPDWVDKAQVLLTRTEPPQEKQHEPSNPSRTSTASTGTGR